MSKTSAWIIAEVKSLELQLRTMDAQARTASRLAECPATPIQDTAQSQTFASAVNADVNAGCTIANR